MDKTDVTVHTSAIAQRVTGHGVNSNRLMVIEDEKLIREELAALLEGAGFSVRCVTDYTGIAARVKEYDPDLILLDINLPGTDGLRVCASIRKFSPVPILFLTGRSSPMDELSGLTLGGNDYVTKPFHFPVLLARIRLLLKKEQGSAPPDCLEYKNIVLKPVAGTLSFGGRETDLTKTELKILYYLFSHAGEIVPRADLVEYLWDSEIHIDDNTLSVNVMRIREKLRSVGVGDLIQTKRGMGYKL